MKSGEIGEVKKGLTSSFVVERIYEAHEYQLKDFIEFC